MRFMSRHARCLSVSSSSPVISMYYGAATTIMPSGPAIFTGRHLSCWQYRHEADRCKSRRMTSAIEYTARAASSHLI
jgi:hypothetical protein